MRELCRAGNDDSLHQMDWEVQTRFGAAREAYNPVVRRVLPKEIGRDLQSRRGLRKRVQTRLDRGRSFERFEALDDPRLRKGHPRQHEGKRFLRWYGFQALPAE